MKLMKPLSMIKTAGRILSFLLLLCVMAEAQGWEYVASARFDRLDGATTEVKAFKNVFNGLVRIQLEQSGGRVRGVQHGVLSLVSLLLLPRPRSDCGAFAEQ